MDLHYGLSKSAKSQDIICICNMVSTHLSFYHGELRSLKWCQNIAERNIERPKRYVMLMDQTKLNIGNMSVLPKLIHRSWHVFHRSWQADSKFYMKEQKIVLYWPTVSLDFRAQKIRQLRETLENWGCLCASGFLSIPEFCLGQGARGSQRERAPGQTSSALPHSFMNLPETGHLGSA